MAGVLLDSICSKLRHVTPTTVDRTPADRTPAINIKLHENNNNNVEEQGGDSAAEHQLDSDVVGVKKPSVMNSERTEVNTKEQEPDVTVNSPVVEKDNHPAVINTSNAPTTTSPIPGDLPPTSEVSATPEPRPVATTPDATSGSSGRRNRRKNTKPRNLYQLKQQVAPSREKPISDAMKVIDFDAYIDELEADDDDDDDDDCDMNSQQMQSVVQPDRNGEHTTADNGSRMGVRSNYKVEETDEVKDYAESTMGELFGMYGMQEEDTNSIVESIPNKYFAAGKILEMSAYPQKRLLPQHHKDYKKKQLNLKPQTLPSNYNQGHVVDVDHHDDDGIPNYLNSSVLPYETKDKSHVMSKASISLAADERPSPVDSPSSNEGIYAKFMDNMKLNKDKFLSSVQSFEHDDSRLRDHVDHVNFRLQRPEVDMYSVGLKQQGSREVESTMISGKAPLSKFAQSRDYIRACFNPAITPQQMSQTTVSAHSQNSRPDHNKNTLPDYSKYVKRYNSYRECFTDHCRDMLYKEHFHCVDCNHRVFIKKEEMIRHFKWHKKRQESLQHGFMRYSPIDDCSTSYGECAHNGRQTHYHCIQNGCNKVYISTSDVQMHANYHRKDSAIIQEGFQRFKGSEDCGTPTCSFYGQRTTHFHCCRSTCRYTFKHKADMEKHKTYHQRDEVFGKDGFKKFMKYEQCGYAACRYALAVNHIHCIRPGCDYVLQSRNQMSSHKRKHEQKDFEVSYRHFKTDMKKSNQMKNPPDQNESMSTTSSDLFNQQAHLLPLSIPTPLQHFNDYTHLKKSASDRVTPLPISRPSSSMSGSDAPSPMTISDDIPEDLSVKKATPVVQIIDDDAGVDGDDEDDPLSNSGGHSQPDTLNKLASMLKGPASLNDSLTLPIPQCSGDDSPTDVNPVSGIIGPDVAMAPSGFIPKSSPPVNYKPERDEMWKQYLTRYTANDPCHPRCEYLYKDHYHCNLASCSMIFKAKDGVRDHARQHYQQDQITPVTFRMHSSAASCKEASCELSGKETHYHCSWPDCNFVVSDKDSTFSRLEHHKLHEFSRTPTRLPRPVVTVKATDSVKRKRGRPPKYPKNEIPIIPKFTLTEEDILKQPSFLPNGQPNPLAKGLKKFAFKEACPDEKCMYFGREHYHCVRNKCHHASDRADVLNLHVKEFHDYIKIMDGFEFFDQSVNCRRPHCNNNRINRHFHCTRERCDYSFVRYSTMAQHDHKHRMAELNKQFGSPAVGVPTAQLSSHYQQLSAAALLNKSLPPESDASFDSTAVHAAQAAVAALMAASAKSNASAANIKNRLQSNALDRQTIVTDNTPAEINVNDGKVGSDTPIERRSVSPINITPQSVVHIAPKPVKPVPTMATIMTPQATTTSNQSAVQVQKPNVASQVDDTANGKVNWLNLKVQMHVGAHETCPHSNCKYKKLEHYHCMKCATPFREPTTLKNHMSHIHNMEYTEQLVDSGSKSTSCDSDEPDLSSSLTLNPTTFAKLLNKNRVEVGQYEAAPVALPVPLAVPHPVEDGCSGVIDLSTNGKKNKAVEENLGLAKTKHSPIIDIQPSHPTNLMELLQKQLNPGLQIGPSSPITTSSTNVTDSTSVNDNIEAEPMDIPPPAPASFQPEAHLSSTTNERASVAPGDDFTRALMLTPVTAYTQLIQPKDDGPKQNEKNKKASRVKKHTISRKRGVARSANEGTPSKRVATGLASTAVTESSSGSRTNNEVPLPDGYVRFRFNTECTFDSCTYSKSMTHYHCTRPNCGYAFSDRSRIYPHENKHAKMEILMGDDFDKSRINRECPHTGCELSHKYTHYHCKKCPFKCTDSGRVYSHRKVHATEATPTKP